MKNAHRHSLDSHEKKGSCTKIKLLFNLSKAWPTLASWPVPQCLWHHIWSEWLVKLMIRWLTQVLQITLRAKPFSVSKGSWSKIWKSGTRSFHDHSACRAAMCAAERWDRFGSLLIRFDTCLQDILACFTCDLMKSFMEFEGIIVSNECFRLTWNGATAHLPWLQTFD